MGYNKAWEVGYVRDRDRGVRRYVEAADTRTTLTGFLEATVSVRALARASGLSDTAIATIIDGRRHHVQQATKVKVAALTLADVYERAVGTVPAVGTGRRVQALMAIGWRKVDLEAAGIPAAQLVTRSRPHVTASTWRQVRQVYDKLSMTPGPSTTARERATRRGYAPPLAWAEDEIDDPRAHPHLGRTGKPVVDPVAVARVVASCAGKPCKLTLTSEERRAATRDFTSRGVSARVIAGFVGVSARTVTRWRQHHGTAVEDAASNMVLSESHNATGQGRLSRSQRVCQTVQTSPGRSAAPPAL